MARLKSNRLSWATIGSVLLLTALLVGPAQAAALNMSGTMKVTQVGNQVTVSSTATTNATTCWNIGDTFMFTDTETTDNIAGNGVLTGAYKIELYEWVGGALGQLIDGPYFQTHFNVPAGQQMVTNLVVSGTYNGWNGIPPGSCQLSFHVYRHWGQNNPNNARSDWY